MPSGTALGIGQGLQDGVDSFLRSFYAAKQFKQQQKDRENDISLAALRTMLADETLPMDAHAQILDEIQRLAQGGKIKGPKFSSMIDLESLMKVREEQKKEDSNRIQNEDARKISQDMGGELPPEMAGAYERPNEDTMKRRGSLSAFQIKQAQRQQVEGIEDERTINRAKKIAEIEAQVKYAAAIRTDKTLGFNKPIFAGVAEEDQTTPDGVKVSKGDFISVSENDQGDRRTTNLGKVKSERLLRDSGYKPSAFVKNKQAYYISKGKTEKEAMDLALEDFDRVSDVTQQGKEAGVRRTEDVNTGATPRTPEQVAKDAEEDDKFIRDTLKEHRQLLGVWKSTFQDVKTKQAQKDEAYRAKDKAKAELDALLNEGYSAKDDQVKAKQVIYEARNNEAIKLQQEFDASVKANESAYTEINGLAKDLTNSPHKDKFILRTNEAGLWDIQRNPNYKKLGANEKIVNSKEPVIISTSHAEGEENPTVRAYANKYFKGDYAAALAAIREQEGLRARNR